MKTEAFETTHKITTLQVSIDPFAHPLSKAITGPNNARQQRHGL